MSAGITLFVWFLVVGVVMGIALAAAVALWGDAYDVESDDDWYEEEDD